MCFFCGSLSQLSARQCKEPSRQLVLACFQREVLAFCEASIFVLQKRTGPKELEVYLRFLELTHHVRSRLRQFLFEGHVPSQTAAHIPYDRLWCPRKEPLARRLSQSRLY